MSEIEPTAEEKLLRAIFSNDHETDEAETCVCAPQWIASGGGCMCWPITPTPAPTANGDAS